METTILGIGWYIKSMVWYARTKARSSILTSARGVQSVKRNLNLGWKISEEKKVGRTYLTTMVWHMPLEGVTLYVKYLARLSN